MPPLPNTLEEQREYHAAQQRRREAVEHYGAANIKPLPHQISPEYAALHSELCRASLDAERCGTALAELVSARNRLSDYQRWSFCQEGAKALSGIIGKAMADRQAALRRAEEIRSQLDALFAAWCAERGVTPGEFIECSYGVKDENLRAN